MPIADAVVLIRAPKRMTCFFGRFALVSTKVNVGVLDPLETVIQGQAFSNY